MEKYTKFSDSTTGLNPFIPVWSNYRASWIDSLMKVVLFPLAIVKLALLCVNLLILISVFILTQPFESLGIKFIRRMVVVPLCRLLLLFLGFYAIEEIVGDYRRLRILSNADSLLADEPHAAAAVRSLRKCDKIVLSTFTNFAEIIFVYIKLNPTFAIPHKDGVVVTLLDLPAALQYSFGWEVVDEQTRNERNFTNSTTLSIRDAYSFVMQRKAGPLVILPERMKSNSSCILKWHLSTDLQLLTQNTGFVAFQYNLDGKSYGPPHTTETPFRHIFKLLLQPVLPMKVTWVTQRQVAASLEGVKCRTSQEAVRQLRKLQQSVMPGSQAVEVDGDALKSFTEYFNSTQRTKYA